MPPCWPTRASSPRRTRQAIIKGLDQVAAEIESGKLVFSRALEDVHMNVESRLKELIGKPAGRLHTARSRNDQVATDFRLYVRERLDGARRGAGGAAAGARPQGGGARGDVMPGFTHLQPAQPVTFGHHLLAYVEMLGRDRGRLADARKRLNECPLGAAALAGTSFPIDRARDGRGARLRPADRQLARRRLRPRLRAGDAGRRVDLRPCTCRGSPRRSCCGSTPQFGFVRLSDKFTTGSSIMPQKRNPDAAELVRAKVGRIAARSRACSS